MYKPSNREKILRLFFDSPKKAFQIREASRLTGLGLPSVRNYFLALEKEGLIKKSPGQVFPFFVANRENALFKRLKVNDLLLRIELGGLVRELNQEHPDCVVLFGSAARGEDTQQSDLDLFVGGKSNELGVAKFEKKLNRKINILFEPKIRNVSKELKNNLANGIVLAGYLDLE